MWGTGLHYGKERIRCAQIHTQLRRQQYGIFKPPEESVEKNTMGWWKYVLEATRGEVKNKMKQWNWDHIKALLASRTTYIRIYKKMVKSPELVTTEEQESVDLIHKKYAYEDILSWRKLANASLKDEEEKDKFEAKVTNFFNTLFSDKVCYFHIMVTYN